MIQTYFLGANSRNGFYSLYRDFPPAPDAFLHILKSGPGTGKSGFLRRIGREAEARGLDVHYVLCSGDPDSLDGVYVPSVGQAWVDGTAPHVIEPEIFGADSDYINLGAFFREPFSDAEKSRLKELHAAGKKRYQEAYRLLKDLSDSRPGGCASADNGAVQSILRALPDKHRKGNLRKRFLSAVSCKGFLRLTDELARYQIVECASSALEPGAEEARRLGWDTVLCPSPLEPDVQEALLIPEAEIAFTAFQESIPEDGTLLNPALGELKAAKALHDEIEFIYHPHIHFQALDAFIESVIERVFSHSPKV